jgi:hypothetical protein
VTGSGRARANAPCPLNRYSLRNLVYRSLGPCSAPATGSDPSAFYSRSPPGRISMRKAIVLAALASAAIALFTMPSLATPGLANPSSADDLVMRVADLDRPAAHSRRHTRVYHGGGRAYWHHRLEAGRWSHISTSTLAIPRRATKARSTTPASPATIAAVIAGTGRGWGTTITGPATGAGWAAATITTGDLAILQPASLREGATA